MSVTDKEKSAWGLDTNLENRLGMVEYAVARLRMCGFEHVYSSRKSEACYYRFANKTSVIRVATHRYNGKNELSVQQPVASCLTFGANCNPQNQEALDSLIEHAVGRYLLSDGKGIANWRSAQVTDKPGRIV